MREAAGGRTDDGRTNGQTADVDSFEGDKSKSRSEQKRNISIRPGNPQAELCVSRLRSKGCHFAPQCISNSAVLRCRSTVISIRFVLKFIGRSKASIQYSISRLHVHTSQQKPIHRSLPSPKNYRRRSRAREAIAAVATASCVQ